MQLRGTLNELYKSRRYFWDFWIIYWNDYWLDIHKNLLQEEVQMEEEVICPGCKSENIQEKTESDVNYSIFICSKCGEEFE